MASTWPTTLLFLTLALFAIAIIAPWLSTRRGAIFSVVLCVIASATWWGYEVCLHSVARRGDPLIRVDWFLLLPLFGVAWLQAFFLCARRLMRK